MHWEWICLMGMVSQLLQKKSFAWLQTAHFLSTSSILPQFLHESIRIVFVSSFWYIILGKLTSLHVLWTVYHTLWPSITYYNHENTNNSKNQHLEQNGPCSIQKSCNIWPHLHWTWNHDRHRNWCLLGCRGISSSTYFFILKSLKMQNRV